MGIFSLFRIPEGNRIIQQLINNEFDRFSTSELERAIPVLDEILNVMYDIPSPTEKERRRMHGLFKAQLDISAELKKRRGGSTV